MKLDTEQLSWLLFLAVVLYSAIGYAVHDHLERRIARLERMLADRKEVGGEERQS